VIDASRNTGEWRGVHRGRDQAKRLWETFVEPWESARAEVEEYIDAGEHVVTRMTGRFLGGDGIEVQVKIGSCLTLHDGLVTHRLAANDFEEALEAAGLSE
jgi:SnoaL-like domain